MNKKTLFAYLRRSPFNGLSQDQVNGVEAVLSMPWGDDRFAAYALATVFHETGGTMKPIVENLNYSAAGLRRTFARYFTEREAKEYERKPQAIANRAYGNRMGNGAEKTGDGWKYRGRGYVQITGKNNYATFGIVQNPDEALRPDIAAKVMFEGMTEGSFTGKKLSDYFNSAKDDPENARRIINGTDKAKLIATHYTAFLAAIRASKADVMPSDVEPEMAKTDDIKPTDSGMVKSILATGAGGVGVSIMQSINNPWALIFAGLIASILAIGAWAYFTGRISFNRAK